MTLNIGPKSRVAAVIVTFKPNVGRLREVLQATQVQVDHTYIVDNGDGTLVSQFAMHTGRALLTMGENRGIAAAQNAGVAKALSDGFTDVLLLDQDSIPAPDLVRHLIEAREKDPFGSESIGAVGAATCGTHGIDGFTRIGIGRFERLVTTSTGGTVDCDLLIASGCLISARIWSEVGHMDEPLFIDKVDTDWCLRARHLGYRVLGVPDARLEHRLGTRRVRFWLGRWREMPIHDASRYYYMVRNSLLIWRRPHATWRWIFADVNFLLQLLAAVLIAGVAGRAARYAALDGIADGCRGVTGRWSGQQAHKRTHDE
jgi:rhamnosyltransferase